MRSLVVLLLIAFVASACQAGSITISVGQPTPTSTWTPTPTVDVPATTTAQAQLTATAQAQANATAQARATVTAQAQATTNAQAIASATAQAQATATAQAQATATARAQATNAARAAATATTQALVAAINAMVDAQTARPYTQKEETVAGKPSPYVTTFYPELDMKNLAAEVEFFNPADARANLWDFGFFFRASKLDQYRLVIRSDKIWYLLLVDTNLPDAVDGKTITQGIVPNLNLAADGTNKYRLVVKDTNGFLFVNDQYIGAMDVSARMLSGQFYIGTGMAKNANFPGLKLHFKNLNVKWLQ